MLDMNSSPEEKYEAFARLIALTSEDKTSREMALDTMLEVAGQRGYNLCRNSGTDKPDGDYSHGEIRPSDGKRKFGSVWLPPSDWQTADYELRIGHKIQAIKAVRASTGLGLKESKDIIDAISGQHGYAPYNPPRY
jgi:hypothetical protein